jgi:hypothetical protein
MSIIAFNQLGIKTKDGRYTQGDLIRKIKKIVASRGCCSEASNSVINSFVMNGIVETYNELGYQRWVEMIHQVTLHEIAERGIQNNGMDTNVW